MVMVLLGGLSVLIVQAIGIGVMISAFRDDKERWRPDCTEEARLSAMRSSGSIRDPIRAFDIAAVLASARHLGSMSRIEVDAELEAVVVSERRQARIGGAT